ncbi:hypothetical protein FQZ97_650460 [compost metagenome]
MPDHRVLGVHADQRQQGRRQVDLADQAVVAARFDAGAQDHRGDVEVPYRHQAGAEDPGVVVGGNQEHSVLPVGRGLGALEEAAQRPVGVADGVLHGGWVAIGLDAARGVFPRRMVRHAEGEREGRPVGIFAQQPVQLIEHVFVRGAPGADECRIHEIGAVHDFPEAVTQEKTLHIVEVRFAAVDEARMVAVPAEQVGQRKEAPLRPGQFQHGLRGRGQEAGDHRLQAAHRAGARGVGAGERPGVARQRVQLRRQVGAAQSGAVLRAQAFLQNDDQVERPRRLAAGRLAVQAGVLRIGGGNGQAGPRQHQLVHLVVVHAAVDGRGGLLVLHAVDRIEDVVERIQRQGVEHAVRGIGHRGRVDRAMAEGAADGQDDDRQDRHAGDRHLPPDELRVRPGVAEQAIGSPANKRQDAEAAHQRCLVAAPEHAGDFARMLQVFDEEAVGAAVVFQDERRCGHFQEGQQDECCQVPVAGQRRGQREMPQQRRQHGRQRRQHGDLVRVDAQPAQQQWQQPSGIAHPLELPGGQRQAAERQQRKCRHHENQGRMPHRASRLFSNPA